MILHSMAVLPVSKTGVFLVIGGMLDILEAMLTLGDLLLISFVSMVLILLPVNLLIIVPMVLKIRTKRP